MTTSRNPIFRGAFDSPDDESLGLGKRPVVFDILAPDFRTSLLPDGIKMVMHVNPSSMKFSYAQIIERIQTKGGYVEQHYGIGTESISYEASSGAFMRLYAGLMGTTGGGVDIGGTRRDTLAYDTYVDLLATFKNNGAIFDSRGNILFHGIIKCSFDGDYWLGWFNSFQESEDAEKPYQFSLSFDFTVAQEFMTLRTTQATPDSVQGVADLLRREFSDLTEQQATLQAQDVLRGQSDQGWQPLGTIQREGGALVDDVTGLF